jgi:tripartite-type tricarboxylate transporter receptor subunit TctC
VPVQVINKPGAAAVIGSTDVTKARPDGYTIGSLNIGPMVSQVIAGNTPYQLADFETIGLYDTQPYLLLAKQDAPYNNMKELADYIKSSGKTIAIGNFGPATVPTLSVHRMAQAAGWKFKSVTFPSTNFNQIQSGDVELIIVAYPVIAGNIKAGQAKALVAMTPGRIAALPNVLTVREQGFDFDVSIWSGLFAPKGTPSVVLDQIAAALKTALTDPAVIDFSAKSAIAYSFVPAEKAHTQIMADMAGLRPVMDALGLAKTK